MPIQLTPEQEVRLQAVVNSGAYPSVDAALTVVETATHPAFEGRQEEFEELIAEGISSGELSEEEFWNSVDRETDTMLAARKQRNT